jgi:DNA-binding MarR family transcriptional regulator
LTANLQPFGQTRKIAAILGSDSTRVEQLAELASACGCIITSPDGPADFLLTDLSSISGQTAQDYSEIANYLNQYGAQALVWIDMDQLDAAYAALPEGRSHILIDTDDAIAVPILTGTYGHKPMDQLHDHSRDADYGALHKISDDLADFARTLARIAEQEGTMPAILSDKPISFRPAAASVFEPMIITEQPQSGPSAAAIRDMIKLRRLREQHFPTGLFADPGWDILLDLYAAKLEGKAVSVSSLCIAAAVPPTTGLRWITTMTEHGELVRRQDPNDARRVFVELSADSEERLKAYFKDAEARSGRII